ncbi:MAG: hypothetical protein P8M05_07175 [Flavobacteriales bacterium]|nr:hypothetical protein [Flavobacteriales bacterium]
MIKISLLFALFILFSSFAFSQNIQDKKVNYSYIQLPAKPFQSGTEFFAVTVSQDFKQRNQDSLDWYENRLKQVQEERKLALEAWNNQKVEIERTYYTAMSNWAKLVKEGDTTAAKPADIAYGSCPCIPDPNKPFLTDSLPVESLTKMIKIAKFDRTEGGAQINLAFQGFDKGTTKEKRTTTGQYTYSNKYKHPVKVTIKDKDGSIAYNAMFPRSTKFQTFTTQKFKSPYDFKLWWMDNEETFWEQRQKDVFKDVAAGLNSMLANDFGYPTKSKQTEIYTAKDKNHDYTDLLEAFQNTQDGLLQLASDRNKDAAMDYLGSAVSQYQTILNESNINDKKSRINKKVTAAIYCNLAECLIWMDDFSQAELYLNKAANLGVGKYKRHGNNLKPFLLSQKKRYAANQ